MYSNCTQHVLGEHLMPCFNGASKVPCSVINLKRAYPSFFDISTAECGTIQLEFRALARAVYEMKYEVIFPPPIVSLCLCVCLLSCLL
jgi:hypothetical protein